MTTTDTPRTDSAFGQGKHGVMKLPYETSCQLERELQKAEAEVEFWKAKAHEAEFYEGNHEANVQRLRGLIRKLGDEIECPSECGSHWGDYCDCNRLSRAYEIINQRYINPATEESSAPQK